MERYDVVVVGGSIAGIMTAITLGRKGVRTLIIERKKEPGEKVFCAEGISTSSYHYFFEYNPRWISTIIDGVYLFSPTGNRISILCPNGGYILERKIMERDLFVQAVEYGVDFWLSTSVKGVGEWEGKEREVVTSKGKVKARIVIGADGINTVVGRDSKLVRNLKKGEYHTSLQAFVYDRSIEKNKAELHAGVSFAPGGYGWVFPKGENFGWAGIGIDTKKAMKNIREYFKRFVERRLGNARILFLSGGGIPTKPLKKRTSDGIILVGDAGRFPIPVSGGGISHALYTGKLAGEVCYNALDRGSWDRNTLGEFDKRWRREWGREENWFYLAKKIFMKLRDEDFEKLYQTCKKIFHGKNIKEIKPFDIVKKILTVSPELMKIGKSLIGGKHGVYSY